MAYATLKNPQTGERIVIESGSAAAQKAFGEGFVLDTSKNSTVPSQMNDTFPTDPYERLSQLKQGEFGVESALRNALPRISPEFTMNREAQLARYGDPKSNLYIENPYVRQQVINQAASGQQKTFQELANRLQNVLGVQATQAQTALEKQQQEFENSLALRRTQASEASAYGSGGSGLDLSTAQYLKAVANGVDPSTASVQDIANAIYGEDATTKSFQDFVKEVNTINPGLEYGQDPNRPNQSTSINYNSMYSDYLDAQHAIEADPTAYQFIISQPDASLFSPLLSPPTTPYLYGFGSTQQTPNQSTAQQEAL